mmetsp:Transcript_35852/g.90335  ORF Transcript_35852/g.90335 Transcript_35852/m.90335 type:complete len:92 (+) Transcript_35852:1090-1365(+)
MGSTGSNGSQRSQGVMDSIRDQVCALCGQHGHKILECSNLEDARERIQNPRKRDDDDKDGPGSNRGRSPSRRDDRGPSSHRDGSSGRDGSR